MNKEDNSYKTISEVVKILNLKSKKGDSLPTHTLRFWEKEFKQIKPKILTGNRRYYDKKNIELLKKIHFLLKDQGMTIKGVKKILNNKEPLKLDEMADNSIRADNLKKGEENLDLADEIADVLWVLMCIANQTGVDLTEAFRKNMEKKDRRDSQRHLDNKKLR